MATSRCRTFLSIIISTLAFSACTPWSKLFYQGDGTLSDRSELNRPRYIVSFSQIPIFEVGNYKFHFRGLPNEQMTLVLQVDKNLSLSEDKLKILQTAIEAHLTDSRGNDICKSSRLPALNDHDSVWVLSEDERGPMFWHWECHNFQAHPRESYELTIRITRADPHGEKILVTPTLQGGGIEFP